MKQSNTAENNLMILVKILRFLKVIRKINKHTPFIPAPYRESEKEGVLETPQFSCYEIAIPCPRHVDSKGTQTLSDNEHR